MHRISQKPRNKKCIRRKGERRISGTSDALQRAIEPEKYTDVLDKALTAAETLLCKLLSSALPEKVAYDFRQHIDAHLVDELENIRNHGHRNDDPGDLPAE